MLKRNWIGHTLQKETGAIEETASDWNPQGYRRRGRPKRTWWRTIDDEIRNRKILEWGQGDSWIQQRLEALHGCPVLHKE